MCFTLDRYACETIMEMQEMSASCRKSFQLKYFSESKIRELEIR